MSRRRFISRAGAGIVGVALASCTGSRAPDSGAEKGAARLTFFAPADDSGTLSKLVGRFNQDAAVEVTYRPRPPEAGTYLRDLRSELEAGRGPDVIGADVTWSAYLAGNGWALDVGDRFDGADEFMPDPIRSTTFGGSAYGVPWVTDMGMLYYRADLLEIAGLVEAPSTWAQLQDAARTIQRSEDIPFGIAFDAGTNEDGVAAGVEFIWSSGGEVVDPRDETTVVIDSRASARGLAVERALVEEGLASEPIVTSTNRESRRAFLRGDALFMRDWSRAFALASGQGRAAVDQSQIGVTALPTISGDRGSGALGGWNLFVNANAERQDEAFAFVSFLTSEESQRTLALDGGYLPTRARLYDDQKVLRGVPLAAAMGDSLSRARLLPVSSGYPEMATAMASTFNQSVRGSISPGRAVAALQSELQAIVDASPPTP